MNNNILNIKKGQFLAIKIYLFLFGASVLAAIMLFSRIYYTGSIKNSFLLWNLFLAWIPYFLSLLLLFLNKISFRYKGILLIIIGFVWLLFYPNAPYIMTDLIHLSQYNFYQSNHLMEKFNSDYIIWYDFMLFTIYSWVGLMIGYVSLFNIHTIVLTFYKKTTSWLIVISISYLSGFGIFLGRFIRFNSWDIIFHPMKFLLDIIKLLSTKSIIFTIMYGSFLLLFYSTLYFLTKWLKRDE